MLLWDNTDLLQFRAPAGHCFSRCELYSAAIGELDVPPNEWSATFKYIFRANWKAHCLGLPHILPETPCRLKTRQAKFVPRSTLSPLFTDRSLTLPPRSSPNFYPPDNDPIIPADAGESRAASDRVFAHSARRSGVARMYGQAGGAREMAHETCLLARFEPLLG